jgi:hypothetical protein
MKLSLGNYEFLMMNLITNYDDVDKKFTKRRQELDDQLGKLQISDIKAAENGLNELVKHFTILKTIYEKLILKLMTNLNVLDQSLPNVCEQFAKAACQHNHLLIPEHFHEQIFYHLQSWFELKDLCATNDILIIVRNDAMALVFSDQLSEKIQLAAENDLQAELITLELTPKAVNSISASASLSRSVSTLFATQSNGLAGPTVTQSKNNTELSSL